MLENTPVAIGDILSSSDPPGHGASVSARQVQKVRVAVRDPIFFEGTAGTLTGFELPVHSLPGRCEALRLRSTLRPLPEEAPFGMRGCSH